MPLKKHISGKLLRLHKQVNLKHAFQKLRSFGKNVGTLAIEVKAFCGKARHFSSRAETERFLKYADSFYQRIKFLDNEGKNLCKGYRSRYFPYTFDATTATLSEEHMKMNFVEKKEYVLHKCLRDLDQIVDYLQDMKYKM